MTSQARVSVVIPTRNMGEFVVQAVESAITQSLVPHEVIVVDDNSTDGTFERLANMPPPVRVLRGPGQGAAIARNLALLAATGDYVAFLDADDMWLPGKLERQLADLQRKGADVGYTDFIRGPHLGDVSGPMMADVPEMPEGHVFERLLERNVVLTSSVIVRRELFGRSGVFKPSLKGGQDIDLWLRLARFAKFACLREPLVFYRQHGGNITASKSYKVLHALRWAEVHREHADVAPPVREYIRGRWTAALYEAGRHAWWDGDLPTARQCFRETLTVGPATPRALFWYGVASLPGPVLGALHRLRQALR
jgi:glycosyltransferase involved in cell wall biosynthesis